MIEGFIPYWERNKKITAREIEILELIRQGYNEKQIAEMKGIQPNSVYVMKWKLSKKLDKMQIPEIKNKVGSGSTSSPRENE